MRPILVTANEVKAGDITRFNKSEGSFVVISVVHENDKKLVSIYMEERKSKKQYCFLYNKDDEIVLVHRPWPEGKTQYNMWRKVEDAANAVSSYDPVPGMNNLRDAIDDYLMGLPEGKKS